MFFPVQWLGKHYIILAFAMSEMHAVASRLIIKKLFKTVQFNRGKQNIKNSQSFGKKLTKEKKETLDTWHKQGHCGKAKLVGDYIYYQRTNVQIKWWSHHLKKQTNISSLQKTELKQGLRTIENRRIKKYTMKH